MIPRIVTLAERPDLATTVARWQWQEWGCPRGRSLDSVLHEVTAFTDPAAGEASFVLLEDGAPVGTACLTATDLDTRPDLSPWLASVFVEPQHRGRGHATRLVRAVERAATGRGHLTLWLFTWTTAALYTRLGWEVAGLEKHHGGAVTLMRRDLAAAVSRAAPPPAAAGL
jgi:GNAT superfamily N-acetyltransferase